MCCNRLMQWNSWVFEHQSFYWVRQLFCYCVHNVLMVLLWHRKSFWRVVSIFWIFCQQPVFIWLQGYITSFIYTYRYVHASWFFSFLFFFSFFSFFLFSLTCFLPFSQPASTSKYSFLKNMFSFWLQLLRLKSCMLLAWNVGDDLAVNHKFPIAAFPSFFSLCASLLLLLLSFVFPGWISISWRLFWNSFFYSVGSSASYCCNILYR